jgi:hypothetical protein
MPAHPDRTPVRAALALFYAEHGLPTDGGASARWVRIHIAGPIAVYFPNFDSRRQAVLLHDLHHLATGYPGTFLAEAEIGAWEIGGGCGRSAAAWVLNTAALGYGIFLAPRRVHRAFVRGRHCDNLYHESFDDSTLDGTVGDLRRRFRLDQPAAPATRADTGSFLVWFIAIASAELLGLAVLVVVALRLASWWTSS